MIIFNGSNNEIRSQVQCALNDVLKLIELENIKLKILQKCLKNINNTIQNTDSIDCPAKLIKLLRETKINLDGLRSNILNLNNLKNKLENLQKNFANEMNLDDSDISESINEYNAFAIECKNSLVSSDICVQNFLLQYAKASAFVLDIPQINEQEAVIASVEDLNVKLEDIPPSFISPVVDNNVLLISEVQNKVVLPYKVQDLEKELNNSTSYTSIEQIIQNEYTFSLSKYKNATLARFKEAFNLMRKKEKASIHDSLDLALELSFNSLLNPAIISACKNLDQLDIYLDCLASNELDKFDLFDIKYEMLPKKI